MQAIYTMILYAWPFAYRCVEDYQSTIWDCLIYNQIKGSELEWANPQKSDWARGPWHELTGKCWGQHLDGKLIDHSAELWSAVLLKHGSGPEESSQYSKINDYNLLVEYIQLL